jgi:hypothetical protein
MTERPYENTPAGAQDVPVGGYTSGELYPTTTAAVPPPRYSRVSWGAILAGAVAAIAVQVILGLLGLAIGLTTIEPTHEEQPLAGLGVGGVIWWILTTIIALFVGGAIAGRLAGVPRKLESAVHGGLAWGVVAIFTVMVVTSALNWAVSGAATLVGQSVAVLGSGVSTLATAAGSLDMPNMNWQQVTGGLTAQDIQREARQLLQQTDKPALQPGQLEDDVQNLRETARDAARTAATRPGQVDEQYNRIVSHFISQLEDVRQAVDRDAVVNVLTARTDLTEQEARQTVDRWEKQYNRAAREVRQAAQNVREGAETAYQEAADTTARVTESVAEGMAAASFWSFVAMLLGAGSAVAGGWLFTPGPRGLLYEQHRNRTTPRH